MSHDTTEPKYKFTNILEDPKYVEINCTPYATSKNRKYSYFNQNKSTAHGQFWNIVIVVLRGSSWL